MGFERYFLGEGISKMKKFFVLICFVVFGSITLSMSAWNPISWLLNRQPSKPTVIRRGDYTYLKNYCSWLIKKKMQDHNVKGLSIALVDNQEIIWAKGFGYADIANQIPATRKTVYNIGSISKLFTATAVMQLVGKGLIDLDIPIQTYLPEFSIKSHFDQSKYPPITARNLMTHHSGLSELYMNGSRFNEYAPVEEISFSSFLSDLKNDYLYFPPNLIFSYSNIGFTILGALVEKISEQNFVKYVDENIFAPCDMSNSSFAHNEKNIPLLAKGYNENEEVVPEALASHYPAGSVSSNVLDLSNFARTILAGGSFDGNQILPSSRLNEMLTIQNNDNELDGDFKIGLGWWRWFPEARDYMGNVAHHGGNLAGFPSMFLLSTDHKLGVIVLENSDSEEIQEYFQWEFPLKVLELAIETKKGLKAPAQIKRKYGEISLPESELRKYIGTYSMKSGVNEIEIKDKKLYLKTENENHYLIPCANGMFSVRNADDKNMYLSFAMVSVHRNTYEVIFEHKDNIKYLYGIKVIVNPATETWRNRAGEYEIINAKPNDYDSNENINKIELTIDQNNILILKINEDSKIMLSPVSDVLAILYNDGPKPNGDTIQVIRRDSEELLFWSGYELRKKRAE